MIGNLERPADIRFDIFKLSTGMNVGQHHLMIARVESEYTEIGHNDFGAFCGNAETGTGIAAVEKARAGEKIDGLGEISFFERSDD